LPWNSPDLHFVIESPVVEFSGSHMHLDEPFPLDAVALRVRHALVHEFNGRCPSVREVDQITDKHWLATPGIGQASLEAIRSITDAGREQTVSYTASRSLSDAELLKRLERFQAELRRLEAELEARMSMGPRRKPNRQRHNRATRDGANHLGH
jgi:hypothetical protein